MPNYRLYSLDGANKIETGDWIEAKTDEEAVEIAHAKKKLVKSELWHGERLIATIPADREIEQSRPGRLATSLSLSPEKRRTPR